MESVPVNMSVLSVNESSADWNGPCASNETVRLDIYVNLAQDFLWSEYQVVYVTIVLPVLTVFGIVTNGSYLFVVARCASMHTATNFYLSNLAVADILFLLFTSASNIRRYQVSEGVSGNTIKDGTFSCFYKHFEDITYTASLVIVVLVTADRFYAVCHPLKHRVAFSRSRAIKFIIAAWVFALLFTSATKYQNFAMTPYCVKWPDSPEFSGLPQVLGLCEGIEIPWKVQTVMINLPECIFFALVLAITIYMYVKIVRALGKRPVHSNVMSENANRIRHHVIRMLLANTIVFFTLNAGLWFSTLYMFIHDGFQLNSEMNIQVWIVPVIAKGLCSINSTVNPIIYSATNPRYRQAFRQAFLPLLNVPTRCRRQSRD